MVFQLDFQINSFSNLYSDTEVWAIREIVKLEENEQRAEI